MNQTFKVDEWTVVLPKERGRLFHSPYLEPASIIARETGSELEECLGCGQLREQVVVVAIGPAEHGGMGEVCRDCRAEHGL